MENEKKILTEINLPQKVPYTLKLKNTQNDSYNEEGEDILNKIKDYIENQVFLWEKPSESFRFNLPITMFNEHSQINYFNTNQTNQDQADSYYRDDDELSPENYSDIFKKGSFTIVSHIPELPYVWQLTRWTVKGYENILETISDELGLAAYIIYCLKFRFIYDDSILSIPSGIVEIFNGISNIISAFIGLPRKIENPEFYAEKAKIAKANFYYNLLEKIPGLNLSIYFNNKSKLLSSVHKSFLKFWENESVTQEQKYFDLGTENSEILKKMDKYKFESILRFLNDDNTIDEKSRNDICQYLKILRKHYKQYLIFNKKLNEEYEFARKKMKDEYPILSRVPDWLEEIVEKTVNAKKKLLISVRDSAISEKISKFPTNKVFYEEKKNFLENYDSIVNSVEAKEDFPPQKVPKRIIKFGRLVFPPYEVEKRNDGYFYIIKEKVLECSTEYIFWRFWLFLIRFYVWTNNISLIMFQLSWNSSFGINALFAEKIFSDYTCDKITGEITPISEQFSYRSSCRNLISWISKSREKFENSPDSGFFGKKFSRIFNLFYNYIFKLFIIGFVVFILYPITIILCAVFFIIIGLTSYAWSLIATIGFYICDILFYDLDNENEFGCNFFPLILIYIIWQILIKGIFQLVFGILLIFLQPIFSLIILIFSFLKAFLRFLYDCFMFSLVKCCGRKPRSDTHIAWKISGPGLSSHFFNHIDIEESLVLVQSRMELLELENHYKIVCQMLNRPLDDLSENVSKLFSRVGLKFQKDNKIHDSVEEYKNIIKIQCEQRRNLYPNYPNNIKYNEQELAALNNCSKDLIKSFVEKREMDFVWSLYGLVPNTWNRLAERVLTDIFGSEIHTNLQEMDYRVELRRESNSEFDLIKKKIFSTNENIKKFLLVDKNPKTEKISLPEEVEMVSILNPSNPFFVDLDFINKEIKKVLKDEDEKLQIYFQ